MVNLSYIIATRNRLPFLKITLEKLIDELKNDEEIVVVDGNSTDGSKEYLEKLFQAGKINQYVSEPDKNQAHAWNKAMMLAKGVILKKIIDDDVFCYKAIRECKNFMLLNPAVDVLISNDLSTSLANYKNIDKCSRLNQMMKWKNGITQSFTFGDVHMLIRRTSLAYIGLYNPSYIMMDWEYSLRISYLKANIAYYTGYNALSVFHPQSVSAQKNVVFIEKQGKRAHFFYEYAGDTAEISFWSKTKIFVGKLIFKAKPFAGNPIDLSIDEIPAVYNYFYDYLSEINASQTFTVIN